MRALRGLTVAACFLLAGEAVAQPLFLFGLRAGVSAPTEDDYEVAPMAGADISYSIGRLVALELMAEQSFHEKGQVTIANLGVLYRIDVTPEFVPYVGLAVESRWLRNRSERTTNQRTGGAATVGILRPFGDSWFGGIEARYGIGITGAFPLRQAYLFRIGYRTAAF